MDDATATAGPEPNDIMTVGIYETEKVGEEEIDEYLVIET